MNNVTKADIEIKRPSTEVYNYISKIENLSEYWPKVTSVERQESEGGVGARYKVKFKTLISTRSVNVEVVIDDPNHIAFKNNSVPIRVINGFKLLKGEEGTTILEIYREFEDTPRAALKSMSFLVNYEESKKAGREFQKILEKLKEEIEK